ncbi:hypothetical protein [Streptomyces sp. RPT161]|uniref:hypothetical protein n=1 Tax=Streptomyces sp. RPT161 TaxID=3015993 RepID=UPI0022B88745|nr:hypothetical protein [Streptomyces sp. RPT161]
MVSAVSLLLSVRVTGRRLTVVLDPHRWLELRRFRPLYESGAMSLREIGSSTGVLASGRAI